MTLNICTTFKIEYKGTSLHTDDTEKFFDFLQENCDSFYRDDNRVEVERMELLGLVSKLVVKLPTMENLPLDREVLINLLNQSINESDQDDNYVHFELF